ncbi:MULTISPECIES: inositol monophosphatase family protein [Vibrio]|uniref:Nus factor SuhB n=1 Tax=Vibrio celticus TaxID=446372 RepID=A0A1C3JCA0_9VIBR|nr:MULTISPECIES: inositol monophosphatase [Vibrio]MDH5893763.1 inositol monophosphatase [Vibrio splendidus]SBT12749.1 Inositol-1-monophosphatase [Vibrio celticus]
MSLNQPGSNCSSPNRVQSRDELNAMLNTVIEIANDAATIAMTWFNNRHDLSVESKGHHDWVSEADREVEQFIRQALSHAYPTHHFFGEELGGKLIAPCWVIDPIDGTTNFLYGHGDFVISIAFLDQNGACIGVIANPIQKRVVVASRGQGAYEIKNGETRPLRPRPLSDKELVIGLNLNYQPKVANGYLRNTEWLIENGHQVRVSGSAAWSMTQVACGELDGCYMGHVYIWDVLAAQLICAEADLVVAPSLTTTYTGPVWAWPKGSILEQLCQPSDGHDVSQKVRKESIY